GPLRRAPRLHEIPRAHQLRLRGGAGLHRRAQLVAAPGRPAAHQARRVDRRDPARRGAGVLVPDAAGSLRARPVGGRPVRGVQPALHAPLVRRAAAAGRAPHPVPLPRGLFRSRLGPADCRAAAPPARADPARAPGPPAVRRRGRGAHRVSRNRPFTRGQRALIVNGMLAFVLVLVVLQLWLLTATMNAYLGGDQSVIWPAAAASAGCFALNLGLLRYLYFIERTRR